MQMSCCGLKAQTAKVRAATSQNSQKRELAKTAKKVDLIEKTSAVELIKAEEQPSLTLKDQIDSNDEEIFDSPRSSQSEHLRRMIPSAISSGADISADGEGYDRDDCDVTENKRRKSKIELDRIRQLGEKQKIKEKSREREPVHLEPDASGKDQTRKSGPTKAGQEHRSNSSRPTQRNSKPTKNGRSKPDSKPSKKNSKQTNNKPPRSKRK